MGAVLLDMPPGAIDVVLVGVLVCAVATDVRSRRISNRLTYTAAGVGLASGVLAGGWGGLSAGLLGCLVGAALVLLPFLAGGIGAGDLKLLAAIGALKGAQFVTLAAICTGIAGGVLALGYLIHQRGLTGAVRWLAAALTLRAGRSDAVALPYAPAIAAGTLLALLLSRA